MQAKIYWYTYGNRGYETYTTKHAYSGEIGGFDETDGNGAGGSRYTIYKAGKQRKILIDAFESVADTCDDETYFESDSDVTGTSFINYLEVDGRVIFDYLSEPDTEDQNV